MLQSLTRIYFSQPHGTSYAPNTMQAHKLCRVDVHPTHRFISLMHDVDTEYLVDSIEVTSGIRD